jgi:hypothetical protein
MASEYEKQKEEKSPRPTSPKMTVESKCSVCGAKLAIKK